MPPDPGRSIRSTWPLRPVAVRWCSTSRRWAGSGSVVTGLTSWAWTRDAVLGHRRGGRFDGADAPRWLQDPGESGEPPPGRPDFVLRTS